MSKLIIKDKHYNLYKNFEDRPQLKMEYIRTPKVIWDKLSTEFKFTIDACASDLNHLTDRYWTKEIDAAKQNWDNETIYCHPMFDRSIPYLLKRAVEAKNTLSVFLLPASTNANYFHDYIWDNNKHCPRKNIEVRFLDRKNRNRYGYKFATEEGIEPKTGYLRPLMIIIINNKKVKL